MLGRLLIFNLLFSAFARQYDENAFAYQTLSTISGQGYHGEEHYVTTPDGYILKMHRIPYKRYQRQSDVTDRPVVFLMHGLTASSDSYLFLGAEYSIAYNFADAGFDVWMGNARGNIHSRFHVTLDPDDNIEKYEFFDFSWEEIGAIDLPTMIDYVLEYTGKNKLHYIGHSQGGTVFFTLNTMRPEYNEKIESAHLLAGVGYMEYFPNEQLIILARMVDIIYPLALALGIVEIYSPTNTTEDIVKNTRVADYCTGNIKDRYICRLFGVPEILGGRNTLVEDSISSMFEESGTAGASLKQIAHYGQNIRDKSFRRWNYGTSIMNYANYGVTSPPDYDLSLITIKTIMHYTVSDNLLDERDVLNMAANMPNATARKVARDSFLHEDFVSAIDVKELVTDYMIQSIAGDTVEVNEIEVDETEDVDAVEEIIMIESELTTNGASSGLLVNILLISISAVYSLCT